MTRSKSPARILIVDDERNNRSLLELMLSGQGHTLASAASGVEALAMVAREAPDLILLDIMMPGLDGYQVAHQIKAHEVTSHIQIILLSALDDQNSMNYGLSSGADAYLTKPVDRATLCARVSALLAARPATPARLP